MALRYFPAARNDIKAALKWSTENFGQSASLRYQKLLAVAIAEIAANPELTHSYKVLGLQAGVRIYHLKHSRTRAALDGQIVKEPRHLVAYTVRAGQTAIVRLLHERMEITGQLKDAL